MTREEAERATITSGEAATLLGISQSTVTRIPKAELDFATTPKGHRRYRREDLVRYAREHLGLDIPEEN